MFAKIRPLRDPEQILPGDIIGFSGDAWASAGITLATYGIPWWSLSHVGIMGEHDGRLLLYESTTLDPDPCAIKGEHINGSQAHFLDSKLAKYPGKAWHYPLVRELYSFERERLNSFLNDTIGIPYDQLGAFRSGGVGLSWIESLLRDADLSSLFCSEWCCAAHTNIGIFRTDNVSRFSPNRFVRYERKKKILLPPRRLK